MLVTVTKFKYIIDNSHSVDKLISWSSTALFVFPSPLFIDYLY